MSQIPSEVALKYLGFRSDLYAFVWVETSPGEEGAVTYVSREKALMFAGSDANFDKTGLVHPVDDEAPDEMHQWYGDALQVLTERAAYSKGDIAWIIAETVRLGKVPTLKATDPNPPRKKALPKRRG